MKYFDHINRHITLMKIIIEGEIEGRLVRGGQHYKWEDNIKYQDIDGSVGIQTKARDRGC